MSVDMYAICPCGSGKKIKFCKCKESVHQLDEIMKMIDGGQVVPALDEMNSILDENPQAAWVLAIRGRLLLDLREYDSLTENAERFIRLQPSNPLALTQLAAAKLFAGDMSAATEGVLEALTESGQDVDSFVLDVASVLAYSLSQSGNYLTARAYATLGMIATEYEGGATALAVLRAINGSPMINGYLKQIPDPSPRPADAPWAERFDEAQTLLRSNKVTLAESKFDSLRRTTPDSPAVLGGLLTCAIWRGNLEAQSDLLKKLSQCQSLAEDQRVRYLAMSAVVDPTMPMISVSMVNLIAELDTVDEIQMAMTASDRFTDLPADAAAQFKINEDDVPPRAVFQLGDRETPTLGESVPATDQVPETIATVVVYGRQTDRSARVELVEVREDAIDQVKLQMAAVKSDLQFNTEPGEPMPLVLLAESRPVGLRMKVTPLDLQKLQDDLFESRCTEALINAKLGILDGKSLVDARGDDALELARNAVVHLIEQYDSISGRSETVIDAIYQAAGVQRPPLIQPTEDEIETIENTDLLRVDPSALDIASLVYLLRRAQQVSVSGAVARLAAEILRRDVPEADAEAKVIAYMASIQNLRDPSEAIQMAVAAAKYAEQHQIDHPPIYFAILNLCLAAGDSAGFQNAVQGIAKRYGNNPEVMAQLQQLLIRYGLIRPDGSPRQAPLGSGSVGSPDQSRGSAAISGGVSGGGGGLWTPDQGSGGGGGGGGGSIILP